jgi:2,5-diketo-D-gluconate reductase A
VLLNDGNRIPQLGYGVFQIPPEETEKAVVAAIRAGYRLIDTAQGYGNEEGVGAAIRSSGVDPAELFITTKLTSYAHGRDKALRAFDQSIQRLQVEQLDLFLIHWPLPRLDLYVETWQALMELQQQGRVRSIGVSNFTERHLNRIVSETGVVPSINQVELHPEFPQAPLREFAAKRGIAVEAWGPIGQGGRLLQNPELVALAGEMNRTPAQLVLRWHLQLGTIPIPKTTRPARMIENLDVFSFELDASAMDRIAELDVGERLGPDPEVFELPA